MQSRLFFNQFDGFAKLVEAQPAIVARHTETFTEPANSPSPAEALDAKPPTLTVAVNSSIAPITELPASEEGSGEPNDEAEPSREREHRVDSAHMRSKRIFIDTEDEQGKIASSAYKSLRTRIMHQLQERVINHFMVIGPSKDVGKTLTSVNLAIMLAKHQKKRVILADLDLRAPSVHEMFNLTVTKGIAELASGEAKLSEALVSSGVPNLMLLPGHSRVEDSSELLMTESMRALLNMLQSLKNHIVIFDTPPVLGCDDVSALAPYMGGCLLVVRETLSSRSELMETLQMIGNNCPFLGVAINGSRELNFGHYYY